MPSLPEWREVFFSTIISPFENAFEIGYCDISEIRYQTADYDVNPLLITIINLQSNLNFRCRSLKLSCQTALTLTPETDTDTGLWICWKIFPIAKLIPLCIWPYAAWLQVSSLRTNSPTREKFQLCSRSSSKLIRLSLLTFSPILFSTTYYVLLLHTSIANSSPYNM